MKCSKLGIEYLGLIDLQVKTAKKLITPREIEIIKNAMENRIEYLKMVVNRSSNNISVLEKSHYNEINGIRVKDASTLKKIHKKDNDELRFFREYYKAIFGYAI